MCDLQPGDVVENKHSPRKEFKVARDGEYWIVKGDPYTPKYETQADLLKHHRKVEQSPAVRFVLFLHGKQRESSENEQRGLFYRVLTLAVEANLRFDKTDFEKHRELSQWWTEHTYRRAVECGSKSALNAMEHWLQRPPFVLNGKRLYEGAYFQWEGMAVKVTSFKDKDILIACHQEYIRDDRGWMKEVKTRRVFKLTREDLAPSSQAIEVLDTVGE